MSNKRGAGAGVALALVIIIILIAVIYLASSGQLNSLLPQNHGSSPNAFSTTASISGPVLYGHSGSIGLTYFNPFPEQITSTVDLTAGSSSYLSVGTSTATVQMPASMPSPASAGFNVTCEQANQQSSTTFAVYVENYTQNVTTDVVTYPYGINSATIQTLLPQQNPVPGFLTITATPLEIETGLSSGPAQSSMSISFAPAYYNGNVYTGSQTSSPNGQISSLTITIKDASGGVSSASVFYGSQGSLPLVRSGNDLTLTINNVNQAAVSGGLPLEITAANQSVSTQNLIMISATYNYQYYLSGPIVSCQ